MTSTLLLVQILNGLQFGLILFLIAAGFTLVFGVMDFINLAHGVQYMIGAYLAATFTAWVPISPMVKASGTITAAAMMAVRTHRDECRMRRLALITHLAIGQRLSSSRL